MLRQEYCSSGELVGEQADGLADNALRNIIPKNNPQTGDYSVEIRAVRDPSVSGLQSLPSGLSDTTVTVRATVSDLRGAAVYLQYKKAADSAWTSFGSTTTETRMDDRFTSSVIHSISGLDADTSYNLRASLGSDFSSGVQTATIRTAPAPGISGVTKGSVTHEGASVTVAVSNAFSETVRLWYASRLGCPGAVGMGDRASASN